MHRTTNSKADGQRAASLSALIPFHGQFFYSTQIPVGLWFLTKRKSADARRGTLIDRAHRELTDADLQKTPLPIPAGGGGGLCVNRIFNVGVRAFDD